MVYSFDYVKGILMQKILTFITLISMMFASMSSSECLQPRKHKKESLKKIQQKVLEQSKEIIIESSNLTAAVGESIAEGSALPQELGLRIKDVAQYVKEVVEVLDDGQEGLRSPRCKRPALDAQRGSQGATRCRARYRAAFLHPSHPALRIEPRTSEDGISEEFRSFARGTG